MRKPVKIGVGGPVGSGKTALLDCLCKTMRNRYQLGVVTNDIFTKEDMEFLVRSEALPVNRIICRRDRGMPAYRHPRGCIDQFRRNRGNAGAVSGSRHPVP